LHDLSGWHELPRDISGTEVARKLRALGYEITSQSGSHMRLTTMQHGEHHLTIPQHNPLRVGTLAGILADVTDHFKMARAELLTKLFG
jgi:predicted RNA binding protein YcfA (HicA-like mRNA interferase family)